MHTNPTKLFLILPQLLTVCRLSSTSSSLKFVQILFRHGDRNPNRPWGPNDPNPETVWPQGWGQLTDLGKLQLFRMGESTKRRYTGFLSPEYRNDEIYVRSTGRDRALMSAQCFLAGLFPVTAEDGEKGWNPSVNWQPIPIHSKTIAQDWVMRCTKACPETADWYLKTYYRTSPSIAAYIKENKEFIERVTKAAGLFAEGNDVKNMKKMWKLGGNLHIARRYNKTLPAWATDDVVDELVRLRAKKFESQAASSKELTRLSGGPLLGHLLANFEKFTLGTLCPDDHGQSESGDPRMKDLKMMVYSGHDTNMVFLLAALRLFDPPFWPSYASTIFLELHREDGSDSYVVMIFFQDGVNAELRELPIPGCATPCPLDELFRTFKSTAVWTEEEFEALCLMDGKSTKDWKKDSLPFLIVLVLSVSLFGFSVVAAMWQRNDLRKISTDPPMSASAYESPLRGGGEKID